MESAVNRTYPASRATRTAPREFWFWIEKYLATGREADTREAKSRLQNDQHLSIREYRITDIKSVRLNY
jgi:hypothetical protein